MRDDLHVLSGSYVLDALSEPERDSFERHLQHCPLCEDEVRGLRETAARLALAKTLDPPPQLRPRVLAAAYRTRQLPPPAGDRLGLEHRRARVTDLFAGPHRAPLFAGPRRAPLFAGPRRAPLFAGPRRAPLFAGPRRAPSRPLASSRPVQRGARARPLIPRLAATLAAAAVVVVATLGINQAVTRHQPAGPGSASAAISRVVAAPDARTETIRTSAGGTVTVVVSADERAAVISARGMRSLPSTETYQLWVIGPHGARSAGLLSGTGQIARVLASGVEPGDRIGITVEPAGGTSSPTTVPVIAVPV
ncbi:MAG TPA: anti-sigma factor [Streptosporangiaceae bacterium]|nr:anti-sigma factor [Streptosporangiaceae bacterium]